MKEEADLLPVCDWFSADGCRIMRCLGLVTYSLLIILEGAEHKGCSIRCAVMDCGVAAAVSCV